MRFRDDTRGVTVQVGAVLLFATIIIALSVYQATVVPAENADVEYRHSQQVQGQLVDVRNALVSTAETGNARPATVSLGTEYPNRVFLVNPPPAAGTLRTDTYDGDPAIEVSNVNATNDETRDYLDGSWTQPTKGLSFVPGYNEYRDAPRLRYEASLLSNYYPEQNTSVPLTDQLLVDEQTRTVSLVALNGSLSTSRSSSVAVNPSALSAPAQRVQVQADDSGQPVTVTIPTVVNASVLRNSTNLGGMDNVTVVQNGSQRVTLSVDWDEPFTLRTAKVGVGSGATNPPSYYLTLVESDDDSVTVEARDEYNNPVSGVEINVSDAGLFEEGTKVTRADGRATFEAVDGVSDSATLSILGNNTARERVVATVDTGTGPATNGSEAYAVDWLEGKSVSENPGLSCSGETCTLDASQQTAVTLFADSAPTVDGGTFQFAVSNRSVGTISPASNTTTSTGESATTFTANRNGTGYVYVSGGGSGDRLEITVTNSGAVVYNGDGRTGIVDSSLRFSVTNNRQTDVTVTDIRVDPANPFIARLDDPSTGFGQYASEFYMTTPGDDDEYTTDFGNGRALPLTFDLSDGQPGTDTEHLIEAGESAEYTLYEFLDENDNSVDMSGEEVEITLFFSDGTQTTFTIDGDEPGSPSVDTFQTTDTSKTSGNPKYARFDVNWSVSDETAVQSVDLTMTRVSNGQQVDSASPPVSGSSASGTTTLRGPDQSSNPSGQQYEITLTVTDSDGQSTTETTTVTV